MLTVNNNRYFHSLKSQALMYAHHKPFISNVLTDNSRDTAWENITDAISFGPYLCVIVATHVKKHVRGFRLLHHLGHLVPGGFPLGKNNPIFSCIGFDEDIASTLHELHLPEIQKKSTAKDTPVPSIDDLLAADDKAAFAACKPHVEQPYTLACGPALILPPEATELLVADFLQNPTDDGMFEPYSIFLACQKFVQSLPLAEKSKLGVILQEVWALRYAKLTLPKDENFATRVTDKETLDIWFRRIPPAPPTTVENSAQPPTVENSAQPPATTTEDRNSENCPPGLSSVLQQQTQLLEKQITLQENSMELQAKSIEAHSRAFALDTTSKIQRSTTDHDRQKCLGLSVTQISDGSFTAPPTTLPTFLDDLIKAEAGLRVSLLRNFRSTNQLNFVITKHLATVLATLQFQNSDDISPEFSIFSLGSADLSTGGGSQNLTELNVIEEDMGTKYGYTTDQINKAKKLTYFIPHTPTQLLRHLKNFYGLLLGITHQGAHAPFLFKKNVLDVLTNHEVTVEHLAERDPTCLGRVLAYVEAQFQSFYASIVPASAPATWSWSFLEFTRLPEWLHGCDIGYKLPLGVEAQHKPSPSPKPKHDRDRQISSPPAKRNKSSGSPSPVRNPNPVMSWKIPPADFKKFHAKNRSCPTDPEGNQVCIKYQLLGTCSHGDSCARAITHKTLTGDLKKEFQSWLDSVQS
ncbi:MAG TPA: hypothetical protein V6D20_02150 [Candidatus Obscuribacterales bacterium]